MTPLVCSYCNKIYEVKPYRKLISKACSRKCLWHITRNSREEIRLKSVRGKKAANNRQIEISCLFCKKKIKISPSRKNITKFCSKKCYSEHIGVKYNNKQKYIRINIDGKRVHLHRHMMEVHLGRKLAANEHVHHINHDKTDNRIENLEILSPSDHIKKHKMTA